MNYSAETFKVEIKKNKAGKYFWHIISGKNGKVIGHSESYSSLAKCRHTAKLLTNEDSSWSFQDLEKTKKGAK